LVLLHNTLNSFILSILHIYSPLATETESNNMVDLSSLSLEELMHIKVVSLEEERIRYSPSIVSTYTAKDLNRLGLHTFKDFISFVPSVEVNDTLFGNHTIQVPGLSDSYNQKILFQLNGVPYWAPANGDIPLLGIPISAVEKIEVIRGPGSVLHGTNA
jgi:outer membrane receptor for ferrienterochelin and colicin